jgi:hypothetical protein
MNPARRIALLIVIGAAVLALAVIVLATARGTQEHLLAVIGLLGGVAIVIVSLPVAKGD